MLDYQTIIKNTQEAYHRFFEDLKYLPKEDEITDITVSIDNLQDQIQLKANQAEAHLAYMNKVKEELENTIQSKTSNEEYIKTKNSINKMYDEYIEAQKRLFNLQVKLGKLLHK